MHAVVFSKCEKEVCRKCDTCVDGCFAPSSACVRVSAAVYWAGSVEYNIVRGV